MGVSGAQNVQWHRAATGAEPCLIDAIPDELSVQAQHQVIPPKVRQPEERVTLTSSRGSCTSRQADSQKQEVMVVFLLILLHQ